VLEEKYKVKSDKLLSIEKRVRNEYEERINLLEAELVKVKGMLIEEEKAGRKDLVNQEERQKLKLLRSEK
jgi:hypothetical protein